MKRPMTHNTHAKPSCMVCMLSALLMALSCIPASAQAPEPSTAPKPAPVVSTIMVDVNNDGITDKVELTFDGDTDVDLNIYLGKKGQDEPDETPSFVKKAIAFHGNAAGQNASLEAGAKGLFQIQSLNQTAGTDRWEKTLTIAYRNRIFVVAELNYEEQDGANSKEIDSCRVNFITGRSTRNDKAFTDTVELISLSEWEPDFLPKACEF